MKLLLHIDQRARIRYGLEPGNSTIRIQTEVKDIPDDIRRYVGMYYVPKTGELKVDGYLLTVVDPVIESWHTAFRRLLSLRCPGYKQRIPVPTDHSNEHA